MIKQELSYKDRFSKLTPFLPHVFTEIRKDIRDEHLRSDRGFFKRNFPGKELSKLTADDFMKVYPKFIAEGHDQISEFIANRWLLRNLDIYNFFEERLTPYSQAFEEIVELEHTFAKSLLNDAVDKFGAEKTYIFSVLNSVAFSSDLFNELSSRATSA